MEVLKRRNGFSLLELLIVMTVMMTISAIAMPAYSSFMTDVRLKAVVAEFESMLKDGRLLALDEEDSYGIGFDPDAGKISLFSGRGPDGEWNTGDEPVIRSFRLSDKGAGIYFGCESYGAVKKGLASPHDGVSFLNNNTLVLNNGITGSAGSVYIKAASGAAIAMVVDSTNFTFDLYRWNGSKWVFSR